MIFPPIYIYIKMKKENKMAKEITDTTKNPHSEWVMGGNPRAIEAQEAEGQMELVQSSQFPAKVNDYRITVEQAYEKLGIKLIKKTDDPLFNIVEFPKGWKLVPTEHSMWSHLVDENGNKKASVFYKAAFYDRRAFFNLETE